MGNNPNIVEYKWRVIGASVFLAIVYLPIILASVLSMSQSAESILMLQVLGHTVAVAVLFFLLRPISVVTQGATAPSIAKLDMNNPLIAFIVTVAAGVFASFLSLRLLGK